MHRLLFIFLVVLTPTLAFAQPQLAEAEAEAEAEVEPDFDVDAEADTVEPTTGLGGAIVGGGTATALMLGATAVTAHALLDDCEGLGDILQCSFDAATAIISLGAYAYAPAIALGTWGGGQMAGGLGRYDLTLLGASIGTGTGFGLLALCALSDSDALFTAGMALVPLLQLTGAVVAYELSARAEASHADRRVGPVFSADRNGAVVGIAGLF